MKFTKRRLEVIEELKGMGFISEETSGWISGENFDLALKMALEGFLGYKVDDYGNGRFWFITDDHTKAIKTSLFSYIQVILHDDIPQPTGKDPLNVVFIKTHVDEKWKNILPLLKKHNIHRKDIAFDVCEQVSEDFYIKTGFLKIDLT